MPITAKYGKLYMKDASGNLMQIIPDASASIPDYTGATASSAGTAGLVPAAAAGNNEKFLRADGTWQEVVTVAPSTYQGATSSASGVSGLVPAAASAERSKYLKGDGTWQTVSTSSDKRVKQQFADIPEDVLDAWENVHWLQFKMNDEVQEKGESAAIHTGMIVQDIQDVFAQKGLDANRYDMVSHEEWNATKEERDVDGNILVPASPAYEQWYLRYEQALAIEAAYQRRENERLRSEINALKERLDALEAK